MLAPMAHLRKRLAQRTRECDEALKGQRLTSEVLRAISDSPTDFASTLGAIAESIARLLDVTDAEIVRLDNNRLISVAQYGLAPQWPLGTTRILNRDWVTGRAVVDRMVVQVADLQAEDRAFPEGAAYARQYGHRTTLAVPLLREGSAIGAILIRRMFVKPFTGKQIELVRNFAAQAVIAIENARLLSELRQRTDELSESLEQQTATSEVLKVISSSPGELEPVFQAMLENATRICDAKFGTMYFREGDGFRAVAMHGASPAYVESRLHKLFHPGQHSGFGRMLTAKQVVQVEDAAADRAYSAGDPFRVAAVDLGGVRTLLDVPMLKENEVIGAIAIYRAVVQPFTDKQIGLVQNFAAQAVIAIENARLLSELRQSLQQQTATADVLKVISRSTFDLKSVLNTLVESAAQLCEADMASMARLIGTNFDRFASYGYSPGFHEFLQSNPVLPGRGSASGRAVSEGKTIHIPDVLADREYDYIEGQKVGGYRTLLGIPLIREGAAVGVLALGRSEPRPFTTQQIELAETFADQAVIAIENVRLFEAEQERTRELAKSLEELRTTQDRLVQTEKLASLGQLTAGIAHEIKNPLNFVNNFSGISTELLGELQEVLSGISVEPEKQAELNDLADMLRGNFEKVVHHGRRADAIVKSMLLHSGETSGEHRSTDINALVDESLTRAYYNARAEQRGFEIKLERSFDPAAGEADLFPREITRALLNLISNGFYAATKRGVEAQANGHEPMLAAATRNLGDRVEIRIRDNGSGIPADVRDKMFDPFFTTKSAGEGTGLGLSISHDIIVKQHGGSIEVDTQPGEFAEIRVILPRASAALRERS